MTIPPFSIAAVLGGDPDEELDFDVDTATQHLEADDPPLVANLAFHVRFVRHGKELQVEVKDLSTVVSTECSRCGVSFQMPVALGQAMAFVPIGGFDEDYPVHLDMKKAEADLSDWLRVEILSAMDLFPLCREDCKGRCPTCGTDLNMHSCTCVAEEQLNPFKELEKHFKK